MFLNWYKGKHILKATWACRFKYWTRGKYYYTHKILYERLCPTPTSYSISPKNLWAKEASAICRMARNLHVPEWLQLKKISQFTTLQKFEQRLEIKILEQILLESARITNKYEHAAVDATGLSFINPILRKDFFGQIVWNHNSWEDTIISEQYPYILYPGSICWRYLGKRFINNPDDVYNRVWK